MDLQQNEKVDLTDTKTKPRKIATVDKKDSANKTKHSVVKNETKSLTKSFRKCKIEAKKPHKFRLLEEIGHGMFGLVLRVEDIETGKISALKIMELEDFHPTELKILKLLKKSNARAHHCVELINTFRTKTEIYLQFPMYGPTLQCLLNRGSFSLFCEDEICQIVKQICMGVKFLHDHHIVHSDLKPDNVIFCGSAGGNTGMRGPKIVLIDFGQAFMDPEGKGIDKTVCCVLYRPPESHLDMSVSYPVDVWSVGMLCFLMYKRHDLLQLGKPLEMLAQMEHIFGQFPKKLRMAKAAAQYFTPSGFTKRSGDFNYTLLEHVKFFKMYGGSSSACTYRLFPLMENLLKLDPGERITMNEVIKSEDW